MNKFGFLCVMALLLFTACSDNDGGEEGGLAPTITFPVASARYRMELGSELEIVPRCEHVDGRTTYEWSMDGTVIGTEASYTFQAKELGEFFIKVKVTNSYGTTADELKITVIKVEQLSENESTDGLFTPNDSVFAWKFPWTSMNIPQGRTVKVKAYMIENDLGGTYTWALDGQPLTDMGLQTSDDVSCVLDADGLSQGSHVLLLTMRNDTCEVSQAIHVDGRKSVVGQQGV